MTDERSTGRDEANRSSSRRAFLKRTGAMASPVVFSETVRSKSNGGRPLVVEVKTGYRLPDGVPGGDEIRPPLSATCSPPSYHVAQTRLQVTPTVSQAELDVLETADELAVADEISALGPSMWGDAESSLRLNPALGVRQTSLLTLDTQIHSPEIRVETSGDEVRLATSNETVSLSPNQANEFRFPEKTVAVTARRIRDSERTTTDTGTPSAEGTPPTENVELDVTAVPEVHVENHGRLTVEKLSVGETTHTT